MVSTRETKKTDIGGVSIATYDEAKKPVDLGINKHKACKMMSDARLKRFSFYRYLQKLKDTSDSSSVAVGQSRRQSSELGGPKFENENKNRCFQKSNLVDWGGQPSPLAPALL